jgi:hypothetical protein
MATGKNIEIKIAATGAQQAAAEIDKVEGKVRGMGGQMQATYPQATAAAESVEKVAEAAEKVSAASVPMSEHLGQLAEEMESAGEAAGEMESNVRKIARVQQAQIISQLANQAGQMGRKLQEVADGLQEFDSEMADSMRNAGESIEKVSGAVATLAIGFAAGGPLGAALAGTVVMLGETATAWQEMTIAQARAAQSAATAAELENQLNEMLAVGVDTYNAAGDAAERLNGIREESKAAIDAEISSLESLNRIQNADDSAYKAQRDREDAAAIRGGAAPEDVKATRARDDAAMELRKIDREEAIASAGLREASNAAIGAEGNLNVIKQSPNATPEQIAEAQKTADELKERLRTMEQKAEEERRINVSRRREVRDRAQGRIEGYQGDKDDRLKREAEQQAAKEKRDADRKAAQEDAARRKNETAAERRTREEAGIGREAKALIPKGATDKFRAAVEAAAAGLQDGDQGGELERLAGYIEKLAAAAERNKAVSEAQRIKIAQLEKRISGL